MLQCRHGAGGVVAGTWLGTCSHPQQGGTGRYRGEKGRRGRIDVPDMGLIGAIDEDEVGKTTENLENACLLLVEKKRGATKTDWHFRGNK